MSAIPGSHRARVILSDNDRQLAEASCEFTVISPAIEDTHSAPAQEVQEVHREGLKEEGAVTAPDDLAEVSTGNLSSQNLEATITAQPSPIYQGLSETIYYKISPGEKNDLAGIKVEVAKIKNYIIYFKYIIICSRLKTTFYFILLYSYIN